MDDMSYLKKIPERRVGMRSSGNKESTSSVLLLCHSLEEERKQHYEVWEGVFRGCLPLITSHKHTHLHIAKTESLTVIMPLTRNTMAS